MIARVGVAVVTFIALLIVANYTLQAVLYHPRFKDSGWANGLAYSIGLT